MARTIKLLGANFRSWSGRFASEGITTVHISAPFEQVVADAFGIKDRVYLKKDAEEPDMRGYELGIEWYGANVTIRPKQGTLNEKVKIDGPGVSFRVLRLHDVKIRRHKDDEQMLLSFNIVLLDEDAKMHGLLHAIKKDPMDLDIQPPSKKSTEEAKENARQAGLFKKPEGEEEEEAEE
jgi:hypothetical protein